CVAFFFQAEDGIRDFHVTGVQTCALPIYLVVTALPGETYDDAVSAILPWAITEVAPLAGPASLPRLHAAATARCRSAEAGSTLRSEERRVGKECDSQVSRDR